MRHEAKTLTPKLRFPEFKDAAGWRAVNGNDLFEPIDRRPAPPGLPMLAITQEHGAVPRDHIDYHVSVTEASIASYKEVQPTDFIISLRSFQGGIEYSRFHGICSPAYLTMRRKGNGSDDFFRHLFKSDRFIQQLTRNIEGLRDGKMISYKQFSEQLLPTPDPGEQRKIADCLTSLDDVIAAGARRLEALRAHKKGLMQQLFPRPGENSSRLSKQPGWTLVDFADAIFFQEGPGIMAADFHPRGVPLVRLSGLGGQKVTLDGCNYLDPEKVNQKWQHFRLTVDDLLVSCSATFGRPARVTEVVAGALFYTGLVRFRPKDERLNVGYLEAFLGSPHFVGQAESFAVGLGIKHFGPTHFRRMKVPVPPLAEQQRIAECLSSLDTIIGAQLRKLDGLRLHKSGLMQRLFPSPEGV